MILFECMLSFNLLLQLFAFVAPKIIGGENAPSPVGELGNVEMTQAIDLIDVSYEQVFSVILYSYILIATFTNCRKRVSVCIAFPVLTLSLMNHLLHCLCLKLFA